MELLLTILQVGMFVAVLFAALAAIFVCEMGTVWAANEASIRVVNAARAAAARRRARAGESSELLPSGAPEAHGEEATPVR